MTTLAIYLLGPPHMELDGRPVDLSRRKALALLAYLAVTGQPHRRDSLAALLWPELDQSRARAALRRELSVLNTTLGDGWLEADRDTVQLTPTANLRLDVARFQQLAAATDIAPLSEAAELVRDDFLAGFTLRDAPEFDDWQFFQAESLRQQLSEVLRQLVDAFGAHDDPTAAIPHARRWLALDPLHEPAHRSLMRLYAAAGQPNAALRQYQECRRILAEDLGVEPAPETTALFEQLRAARADAPPHAALETADSAPVVAPPLPDFLAHPPPVTPPPFVAREAELAQLHAHLAAALDGNGRVVCITGEAGSGKTALAYAFTRQAIEQYPGLMAAGGICNAHTGLGDPYLPFRDMLHLLTGDVETRLAQGSITPENARRIWEALPTTLSALTTHGPQLVNTFIPAALLQPRLEAALPPLPAAGDVSQSGLFEQFTGVLLALAAHHPLLLWLDDAQWADAASVNLLFHLSRRLAGSRVLLLVAYRPGDVALGRGGQRHPLEPVVNEIRRSFGPVQVDLSQAGGRELVEALVDVEPNRLSADFRAALHRQTQGHPLFTVELLRDMQVRGDIVRAADGRWVEGIDLNWERLPARVEAVIAERIDRLDDDLRDLLTVASVQGENFTAQVLAQVQRTDERRLLRSLSLLEREHTLIQEQGEIRVNGRFLAAYRFTHTLFQQYLYRTLSPGERRLLHGDVAAALADIYHARLDDVAVPLGLHYAQAGQPAQAIPWLLQAGDRARSLYAHAEAVGFYRQALAFLKETGQHEQAARTLMKLGLTHHMAFEFAQARAAYDEGFALWQRAGSQPSAELPPAPHPLRLQWATPPGLDSTLANDDTSEHIIAHLFSGLVRLSKEMDVVPEVARRWEVLADGSKYLFYLRDDFVWSDGAPVTAEDFVYAWRRVLSPAHPIELGASMLFDIKGARDFFHGHTTDPATIGLRALEPYLLEVELEGPTSYFLQLLSQVTAYPVPRHVVERVGPAWTQPEHLVTNGPFLLAEWQPHRKILLARNPRYPGDFSGNVQQVELKLIEDETKREVLSLYEADELDVVGLAIPLPETERVRQRHAAEYFTGPLLSVQYMGLNARHAPLADARVRRALAMVVDRERLSNFPLPGYHFPATGGFIPPGMPEHSPGIGLPYDPPQARQLLAEAGFAGGQNFPALIGLAPAATQFVADRISESWRENLGINVTWRFEPWKEMLAQLTHASPYLFLIGWRADYPDPDNLLRVSSHRAWAGWHNPVYDDLVRQARRVADHTRRIEMYQQADKILIEDAAIVPFVYGRRHLLVKPWVTRLPTSAVSWYFWKDVVIEPH